MEAQKRTEQAVQLYGFYVTCDVLHKKSGEIYYQYVYLEEKENISYQAVITRKEIKDLISDLKDFYVEQFGGTKTDWFVHIIQITPYLIEEGVSQNDDTTHPNQSGRRKWL